jgi:hypothetical protein
MTGSGVGEVGTNYRGPAVQKWARGLGMLRAFLSFLLVYWFVDLQIIPFRPSPSPSAAESQGRV